MEALEKRAHRERVALLCAEADPWRCHRSLIADARVARGIRAEHLLGLERETHVVREGARLDGERVTDAARRVPVA